MKKHIFNRHSEKKASLDNQIESEICIILLHFIYNFMRQKWKPVFVDMISSFPYVTYA